MTEAFDLGPDLDLDLDIDLDLELDAGDVDDGSDGDGGELEMVRHLILATHDDVVAELIAGGSIGELMASIEPAKAAHRNVVARLAPPAPEPAPTPPLVPAGAVDAVADPASLPPHELIRRGLRTSR